MLKVYQAIVQSFIDAGFGLPIAHQNINYTPENGVAYAEIYVAGNDVTAFDLAYTDETDGIFRVILRYPVNSGAVAAERKSEEILRYYHIGKQMEYDGQIVSVRSYSQEPGVPEDGWYKAVLTIRYYAYLRR